ncbi:MAG: putative 3-methyladenine DNA glycosylase [Rhodothermaceae bacterium]|nr:MAG: putative 3-methyladenine DNA glycosylase [Rhodothermaceae bacterium]
MPWLEDTGVSGGVANVERSGALTGTFFSRPTVEVARALVGCRLIHEHPTDGRISGQIVEVEAYPDDDPAWRSWGAFDPVAERLRMTARTLPLFGEPGRAYFYRVHTSWLLNVVTEPAGKGGCMLLRAVMPEEGLHAMWARRPAARATHTLASGPGNLCLAFDLDRRHHGADLTRPPLWLAPGSGATAVVAVPRVGVRFGQALPYRFVMSGHPACTSPASRR